LIQVKSSKLKEIDGIGVVVGRQTDYILLLLQFLMQVYPEDKTIRVNAKNLNYYLFGIIVGQLKVTVGFKKIMFCFFEFF